MKQVSKEPQPNILRKFVCNKCDTDHNSSDELEEHLECHYEDGDYACIECSFQTNKKSYLKNHTDKTGHKYPQPIRVAIECIDCDKIYQSKKDLIAYEKEKTPNL